MDVPHTSAHGGFEHIHLASAAKVRHHALSGWAALAKHDKRQVGPLMYARKNVLIAAAKASHA